MATRDQPDRARQAESGDSEVGTYRERARRLGLDFVGTVDLSGGAAVLDPAGIRDGSIVLERGGPRLAYIAPGEDLIPAILAWLGRDPKARSRLRVATPDAIRAAMVDSASRSLLESALGRIRNVRPDLSAARVITIAQAIALLTLVALLATAFWFAPLTALVIVNLIGAAFFFGVAIMRLLAADYAKKRASPEGAIVDVVMADSRLPTYTILVPLYREANLVADIVAALDVLDWPRDKLDIKLLLEADDERTIAAARFAAGKPPYEIVLVPRGGPRTKPKALAYAMPLIRGDLVTVYDAEDRPHPKQLREAHAMFLRSDQELACLQSPLVIDNAREGWLPLSFSVEYAGLFDALLPTLAAYRMPLPLGGTSNHFRRAALFAVGGWDPYNVTEDADLGLRFARFGYRTATLDLPTLEEAPVSFWTWFRQRTRWSKGWMQTLLVHSRHPLRLAGDLGPRGLLGFVLVSAGLLVSQLIYPLYLAALLTGLSDPLRFWAEDDPFASAVIGVNVFNLFAGFTAMALLSIHALRLRARKGEAMGVLLLPVFWLVASLACYRALFQLITRPHHWEKTPHRRWRGRRSRRAA